MEILTSKTKASVGRIVHVYCPQLWSGPQPGIVTSGPFFEQTLCDKEGCPLEDAAQTINVNVLVDAQSHPGALGYWRERAQGNTLAGVPLFDAMDSESQTRTCLVINHLTADEKLVAWAEWPPRS